MSKEKLLFLCTECGAEHTRWQGKCSTCGAWNALKEFREAGGKSPPSVRSIAEPGSHPQPLSQVSELAEPRMKVGIGELDRVLGGGMVPGSAILVGGDPGIGKSTLLLEALAGIAARMPVLYASGEESAQQIKMRAQRLGITGEGLYVLAENRLEEVARGVEELSPAVLVADSVQTLTSAEIPSAAGTVSQVRESAARLVSLAKRRGMVLFLVGHVTKEGTIAGPRLLEHMVDTVLYFEGDRGHNYRLLRAVKNRFGAANEIGVFEMRESGLVEVPNPSELFLSERVAGAGGSVVFPGVEGTRPVLVEIQSLVAASPLAQPRRTTLGVDGGRLALLAAVMEKRIGLGLFDRDIFLNVAGGFRITEPAADLAVALSLYASRMNLNLDPNMVVLGEVGLAGEIRAVAHVPMRLKEAAKLGFTRCILPTKCLKNVPEGLPLEVVAVATLEEAVDRAVKR